MLDTTIHDRFKTLAPLESLGRDAPEAVTRPRADSGHAARVALMPSLLTLSDVMGAWRHAAITARVTPGATHVENRDLDAELLCRSILGERSQPLLIQTGADTRSPPRARTATRH